MTSTTYGTISVEEPNTGRYRWMVHVSAGPDPDELGNDLDAVLAEMADAGGGLVHAWADDIDDATDAVITQRGLSGERDLWQLRATLPIEATSELDVRTLETDDEADEIIGIVAATLGGRVP